MDGWFRTGDEMLVFGKLASQKPRAMDHPETERVEAGDDAPVHMDRIVPIYPLTEGLPQRWLRSLAWSIVHAHAPSVPEPAYTVENLPTRAAAFGHLHFPDELDDSERARQRLALDEFVDFQADLRRRRMAVQSRARATACAGHGRWSKQLLASLPFKLTGAQQRVLGEIQRDLAASVPMRRLLHGDVGSGKTVVAAAAITTVAECGRHTLLMAPTEILADQHARLLRTWLEPLGITVALRTRHHHDSTESGFASRGPILVVGTHALLEESFQLPEVGLVIIDEQHKFGVEQRNRLLRKGACPHLLVMTATPIPRTLALTLYGDLDVSVIDHLPGGRGAVRTHVRAADRLPRVMDFIRAELQRGRQAYVVYPRVGEESEEATPADVKGVEREAGRLERAFAPHRVGMLHGRMSAEEKERIMQSFRTGALSVLLATTVVEVGVDVPNATVMLVENAECFGLTQLHQLRGRIGRGPHAAHFILLSDQKTPAVLERMAVLTRTQDGFEVAEADLRLRGPGDLLGQNQSGMPPFRFGDLSRDLSLIDRARAIASKLRA